jgi:hypothetical protein
VELRAQATITRWETDEAGHVLAAVQSSPQTGRELVLPRGKLIYLVDDATTDNPEGSGWWRDLHDTGKRLQRYLDLEGAGFDRDLRGIPVGRAPIAELYENDALSDETRERLIKPIADFVSMTAKANDTGIVLDSGTYQGTSADGTSVSTTPKWDVKLLQAAAGAFADVHAAIERDVFQLALVLGVEALLLGSTRSGSRALGDDKSKNLYLTVNGTLGDLAESYDRDFVTPLMLLNGVDRALWPSLRAEDVAYRDVTDVTGALRDLAVAGAPVALDDPAINDVRDLLGISRVPPEIVERERDAMAGVGLDGDGDPAADDGTGRTPGPGQRAGARMGDAAQGAGRTNGGTT